MHRFREATEEITRSFNRGAVERVLQQLIDKLTKSERAGLESAIGYTLPSDPERIAPAAYDFTRLEMEFEGKGPERTILAATAHLYVAAANRLSQLSG